MDPVIVRVELVGTKFVRDYSVDPDDPLLELCRRAAKDAEVPLRNAKGRPVLWTAEGPDIRPGKSGWRDLTRTQPLAREVTVIRERLGEEVSPLFSVRFTIPKAAEARAAVEERDKRTEIESRMAARAAERDAQAAQVRAQRSASLGEAEAEFVMAAPPRPPPVPAPRPVAPAPPPVESRIRRSSAPSPESEVEEWADLTDEEDDEGGLPPWLLPAVAGTAVLVVAVAGALLLTSEPEPEPTPTPAPVATVPDVVVPQATPTPTPTPAPTATPAPMKLELFWSAPRMDSSNAGELSARMSSFAHTDVKLQYTVHDTSGGPHRVGLKGRFTVELGADSGRVSPGGSLPGATAGTRVTLRFDDAKLRVRVGSAARGPYTARDSGSFPAWRFEMPGGTVLTDLKAWAPAE